MCPGRNHHDAVQALYRHDAHHVRNAATTAFRSRSRQDVLKLREQLFYRRVGEGKDAHRFASELIDVESGDDIQPSLQLQLCAGEDQ